MALNSYTYIYGKTPDPELIVEINAKIQKWKGLFYRENHTKDRTEEAMSKTLMGALKYYKPSKGNLQAYIIKYAKTIMRNKKDQLEVPLDILEEILSNDGIAVGETKKEGVSKPMPMAGTIKDFSQDVIDNALDENEGVEEVVELALKHLEEFIFLAKSLVTRDTTTSKYSKAFQRKCHRLLLEYHNFNTLCVNLYKQFRSDFDYYTCTQMDYEIQPNKFEEANYMLHLQKPKNIELINKDTNQPIKDADLEPLAIKTKKDIKYKFYRVSYIDVLEQLYDYTLDNDMNEFTLRIGKSWLFRSICGNELFNPKVDDVYNLYKFEILTTLATRLGLKCLCIGTENIYLVTEVDNKKVVPTEVHYEIKNYNMDFKVEDITDEVIFL